MEVNHPKGLFVLTLDLFVGKFEALLRITSLGYSCAPDGERRGRPDSRTRRSMWSRRLVYVIALVSVLSRVGFGRELEPQATPSGAATSALPDEETRKL